MLEFIEPYLEEKDIVTLAPYQLFLKEQAQFIIYKEKQFASAEGYESNAIKLLRYMFNFVDWEYMNNQINNIDRYMYHVRFIKDNLDRIFNPATRGQHLREIFFYNKKEQRTKEFIVPIEDTNCLSNLPLDSESWITWKKVKPIYLWTHDSTEYSLNMRNDRITFKSDIPKYAVILINPVALIMKYYVWHTKQRNLEEARELAEYIPQQYFLHKYVMNNLIWDLNNIWLISQLKRVFGITDPDELKIFNNDQLTTDIQDGRIAVNSCRAFEYLYGRIFYVDNFKPYSLLSSKMLFNGSIHKRIKLAMNDLDIRQDKQHEYLRWLRDKDILYLFLQMWSRRKDHVNYKNIIRYMKREYTYMINHRPWNNILNNTLKNDIRTEMENFGTLLD